MEISISAFLTLSVIYFIVSHIGLYKIFEKMGEDGWKALVPFYSTYLAVKMIKKPWSWILVYYIPFLGFVVWMGIIVELLKLLGKTSFKDHFLGVVFAGVYLPYLGFQEDVKFIGYEEAEKYVKPQSREWTDAIVFAVIAATLIRGLYLEAFTIPTSSMEQKLLRGDFLFVNKMAYGARVPNTPISFPFTHHSLPEWIPVLGGSKSYIEAFKFPYTKLPKMGDVQRNDCVVFNFPAGDTVILEHQNRVYDQMVREMGRSEVWRRFDVVARPVDKRENYIKRCVGLPGDKLQIVDGILKVNDELAYEDEGVQHNYKVFMENNVSLSKEDLITNDLSLEFPEGSKEKFAPLYQDQQTGAIFHHLTLTKLTGDVVKNYSGVKSVEQIIDPQDSSKYSDKNPVFPSSKYFNWTVDNFGPVVIPKKGETVNLTIQTLPLYKSIITRYELNELEVKGKDIYINGEVATSYTFKMDYYWMMGDNRNNSQDARYWGFVPEDHIVGKAVFVWMSYSPHEEDGNMFTKIRWDRLFTVVH